MSLAFAAALALVLSDNAAEIEQSSANPLLSSFEAEFFKRGEELNKQIDATFESMDGDGSGFIEGREIAAKRPAVVKSASGEGYAILVFPSAEGPPPDFPTASLERADGDGDDRISATEYRTWAANELDRLRSD